MMKVHEHVSDLGRWRMAQRPAHPRLRLFVHGYMASSSVLPRPVNERLLPSTEVPLVLNFGAPHRRLTGDGEGTWAEQDGVWIVGLHDRPQRRQAVGERDFMIVRFTPFGAHGFLRTPMDEVQGQALALNAVNPKLAALILSRVAVARTWAERFDAMEALIAERVEPSLIPDSLSFAWRRLEASDGRFPLGRLAAELDRSHRVMIAQFRTHVGVTPKALSRVFRFGRAVRAITRAGSPPLGKPYIELQAAPRTEAAEVRWADLAADCGYFDQSHLIKEFRQFAGTTPADFLRNMADVD